MIAAEEREQGIKERRRLDSAMIKPKYHFDRRPFCLCLLLRPTHIAVSALPSFPRSDLSLSFPNQTVVGDGGDFENFDPLPFQI